MNASIALLYAEASEPEAALTQAALLAQGFTLTVAWVTSAADCLAQLERQPCAAVLLGEGLPDGEAVAVLTALAGAADSPPAIVVTRAGDEPLGLAASRLGAAAVVCREAGYLAALTASLEQVLGPAARGPATSPTQVDASELHLATAVKLAQLGPWRYDVATDLCHFNDQFYETIGTSVEQVGGYTMSSADYARRFIHPDEQALFARELGRCLGSDGVAAQRELEHRIVRADGQLVHLAVRFVVAHDECGRPTAVYGVCQDISARKRGEHDLLFQNVLLSTQQEATLDGVLVVDESGAVLSYNRRFLELWQLPAELVATRDDDRLMDYVLPQLADPEAFVEGVRRLYAQRQETSYEELALADGRLFERYSAPMTGPDGRYFGRVWYFRDIGERKRAEERLRRTNRSLRVVSVCRGKLAEAQTEEALLAGVCDTLVHVAEYERAWIGYLPESDEAGAPLAAGATENRPWALAEPSPCDLAVRGGRPVVLRQGDSEPALAAARAGLAEAGLGALLTLPLQCEGRTIGTLEVGARARGAFDADELALLGELCEDLGAALSALRVKAARDASEAELVRHREHLEELVRTRTAQLTQLTRVVEQSPSMVLLTDCHGVVEYVNPSFTTITGYAAEEAVGKQPTLLNSSRTDADTYHELWSTVLAGRTWRGQLTDERRDGRTFIADATISPLRTDGGEITHLLVTSEDVTTRLDALREFKAILVAAQDGFFMLDLQTRVLDVNPAFCQMSGYSRDELMSMTLTELAADSEEVLLARYDEVVTAGSARFELLLRRADGSVYDAAVSACFIDSRGGLLVAFVQDVSERNETLRDLQHREARFRTLFNGVSDGILAVRLDHRMVPRELTEVNDALCRRLGYTHDELVQLQLADLLAPAARAERLAWAAGREHQPEALPTPATFETVHLAKDGRHLLSEVTTRAFEWHGEYYGLSIIRDLAGRQRLERLLSARLRLLQETAALRLEEASRAVVAIVGEATESSDGFYLDRPDDLGRDGEAWTEAVRGREARVYNEPVASADGARPAWTSLVVIPVLRGDRVVAVLGVGNKPLNYDDDDLAVARGLADMAWELLERKRTEQALAASEERLDLALRSANVGLWDYDMVHDQLITNEIFERLTGGAPPPGPRNSQSSLVGCHPHDAELLSEAMAAHVRGESAMLIAEARWRDRGGEDRWRAVVGRVVDYDDDDRPSRAVGVLLDVDERRRLATALETAKEAAEAANLAKSVFLASMSHEIRTPLNAVLGFSQLLERDGGLSTKQLNYVQTINRSGEFLLELINDILEMAKIEAGRAEAQLQTFDLHRLLEDLVAMFRVRAESKQLTLELNRAADLPRWVCTDERKLRQILINLTGNAIKFTDVGGVVLRAQLATSPAGLQRLRLAVQDTGPGIPAAEQAKVFQHFEQSSRNKDGGTGLGLAISREFARLLGGDIELVSTLGGGSTFTVELVLAEPTVDEGHAPPPRELSRPRIQPVGLQHDGPAPRLLVVDDRQDMRRVLLELLGPLGFDLQEAGNGQEAVDRWREWRPDAILMDIRMPVMDGETAMRTIRAAETVRQVRMIAVTASVFSEDESRLLEAGADAVIGKPVVHAQLLEALARLLELTYIEATAETPAPGEAPLEGAAGLCRLPRELLEELLEATDSGRLRLLDELVARAAELDPGAAVLLTELVESFDYDELGRLVTDALDTAEVV